MYVVSCFNLHFPNDIWCGTSFHMLICHLYIFFGEVCVKFIWPFFFNWVVFLLLSFKNYLYTLDNSPLSDVSFANIFSQSVACLLILLTLSFTGQKFILLMESRLSIISSIDHGFSKKLLPNSRSFRCSPMLSSRTFRGLHLIFRSTIHLELIFVKSWRSVSRFFFICVYSFVPVPFVEKTIFAPLYCLCSSVKDQLTVFKIIYFLALYFVPLIFFFFFANTTLSWILQL